MTARKERRARASRVRLAGALLLLGLGACASSEPPPPVETARKPPPPPQRLAWMPLDRVRRPGSRTRSTNSMSQIKPTGTSASRKAAVSMEVAQLAIECIQPTPACYGAVARSLNADRLMWAELEPVGDRREDPAHGRAVRRARRVQRRAHGGPSPTCRRRVPASADLVQRAADRVADPGNADHRMSASACPRCAKTLPDSCATSRAARPVRSARHPSSAQPRRPLDAPPAADEGYAIAPGEPGGQGERDAAAQPQARRRRGLSASRRRQPQRRRR